ncbi:MAG: hypothetical protein A2289_24800 [Deltaproteobacteria bacterium RIFOXYA12_FULL_58_15]|nr:MAG: hypothetical protein A2289_24800 [Deltaproteobacteria bacterium RIFOXYA12_FULL_58_15]
MGTPTRETPFGAPAESPRAEVSSEPASGDLASLVHEELDAKPEKKVPEPAAGFLSEDLPAFAPAATPTPVSAWQPPPMTATFWQKMTKTSGGGIRPVHLILGGVVMSAVAAAVVVVLVWLPRPVPQDVSGAAVPTPAATNPGKATPPHAQMNVDSPPSTNADSPPSTNADSPPSTNADSSPVTNADSPPSTNADSSPATKVGGAKAKARLREEREKVASKEKAERERDEPVEDPVEAAPAGGSALVPGDIKGGVKQGMPAVMGCIKAARAASELVPGSHTLILDWVIAPSGAVTDAQVRGPAAVLNTSLPACFSKGMRKWRFPSSPEGAPVKNFPFGPFTLK